MQYVHHLNPFAIQFTETFGIRWYGLAYLAGFVSGYFFVLLLMRRGRVLLPEVKLADYVTYCAIGALLGGRVGYCLFYSPDLLTEWTGDFPFWGVLKVHKGGMASHGGIFGMLFASYIYSRQYKLPFFHLLDLNCLGGSLGIFFGRMANFINGELYGREAPADLWWAVKFPQEMYLWGSGQLDKIGKLSAAAQALGPVPLDPKPGVISPELWAQWVQSFRFDSHARAAIEGTIERIIVATQNGNVAVVEALAQVLTPRYPSQLIQGLLEGLLVFVVLAVIWLRPRKQGVIASWFGLLYAVTRIIGEQFRMPDAQIGYQAFGLTRGQWLSIAMLGIALAFVIWAQIRPGEKYGGFFQTKASGR